MADQDIDRSEAASPFKLKKAQERGHTARSVKHSRPWPWIQRITVHTRSSEVFTTAAKIIKPLYQSSKRFFDLLLTLTALIFWGSLT